MCEIKICLSNIPTVKTFCKLSEEQDFDIDVLKDHYVVDGKSLLGILSLDLSKPVVVKFSKEANLTEKFEELLNNLEVK